MKTLNLALTTKETADYLNSVFVNENFTDLDVIFLAAKGCFPAFNYVRYSGISLDERERHLYKIGGINGLFECVFNLNVRDIGTYLINDRSIITDEECEDCLAGIKYLVKKLSRKEYSDPRYEIDIDTILYLADIEKDGSRDYGFSANLAKISTKFSALENGVFNGLVKSPFIEELRDTYLPNSTLIKKELNRIISFSDPRYSSFEGIINLNLFRNLFFDIDLYLQPSYEYSEELEQLADDECLDELFYFLKEDVENFCLSMQSQQIKEQDDKNIIPLGSQEIGINNEEKEIEEIIRESEKRISQPQRDLFALLVVNCYPNYQSRNALFEAINADLKEKGIKISGIQYSTFDRLIDEKLRINNKTPFPPKQK